MKYDVTKVYATRQEAEKVAETLRPLQEGDTIKAMGVSRIITEVYDSCIYIEYSREREGYLIYFMCEFKANENYGNYKSYFDGGIVELAE